MMKMRMDHLQFGLRQVYILSDRMDRLLPIQPHFICIKNITVDANTTYIFRYNKVKGSGASVTKFGWRDSSSSSWSYVNETTDEGTISQEFTTGDFTKIDIMVQSPSEGAHAPYTSVDLFKLIKK